MSGEKKAFPVAGLIQSSSRIVISQPQSQSPNPGSSKPQSYKVFVLPPSQLNSLGLVAKTENGRVILTQRPVENTVTESTSPNASSSVSLSFIKSQGGIQIQSNQPSNVAKTTPRKSHATSGGETARGGVREFQMHRQLTKINPPAAVSPVGSSPVTRPMFSRRTSSRRLLPQFTKHWKSSLEEVGYIRCPLRGCNYICLSFGEMTIHYYQCKGEPFASKYVCAPCNGRLKSKEDLQNHLHETHSREGRIAKQHIKKIVVAPKQEEKAQVWIRKRAYSKVHKISWNISLEEKGYVNCFFKNCCFMALNLQQMIQHYGICNGTTAATAVGCPYCGACAESEEKLSAHIQKTHADNTQVVQVTNSSVTIPMQEINIASAATSGVVTTNLSAPQCSSIVVQPHRQPRAQAHKSSVSANKTVQTILSMTDTFPEPSLHETQSVLYTSDAYNATTTTTNLPNTVDSEVHCLFSMYEDFEEQPVLEKDLSLENQSSNISFSIEKECENTNTVLCKTYSKDNQRLVKDVSYTERISSPLSALPCSFSDNISFCSDVGDVQVMRSSMSEAVNNVMLVEAKPEASAVEKLHEYMSNCEESHTLRDGDSSAYASEVVHQQGSTTEILPPQAGQSTSCPDSQPMQNNVVDSETCDIQYEIFNDTEPEYPQEYNSTTSADKNLNSDDINLHQNAIEEDDQQVAAQECLFVEPYTNSSLVSYTDDVEEYIIPEVIEIPHLVVPSSAAPCDNSYFTLGACGQRYGAKQNTDPSQVPVNVTTKLVPGIISNMSSGYKIKQKKVANISVPEVKNMNNSGNNSSQIDAINRPQVHEEAQEEQINVDEHVTLQENSVEVGSAVVSDEQTTHPLFADTDDIQNIQVPDLLLVADEEEHILPEQLSESQNLTSTLITSDKNLYIKEETFDSELTPVLNNLMLSDDNSCTCIQKLETDVQVVVTVGDKTSEKPLSLKTVSQSDQSPSLNMKTVHVFNQCNVEEPFDRDPLEISDRCATSQSHTSLPPNFSGGIKTDISDQSRPLQGKSIKSELKIQVSETLGNNKVNIVHGTMLNDIKQESQTSLTSSDIHTDDKEETEDSEHMKLQSKVILDESVDRSRPKSGHLNFDVNPQSAEVNFELSSDIPCKAVVTPVSESTTLESANDHHEVQKVISNRVKAEAEETSDQEYQVLEEVIETKELAVHSVESQKSKKTDYQIFFSSFDRPNDIQIIASEMVESKINQTEECTVSETVSSINKKLNESDTETKNQYISKGQISITSSSTLHEDIETTSSQSLNDNIFEHDGEKSKETDHLHNTRCLEEEMECRNLNASETLLTSTSLPDAREDEETSKIHLEDDKTSIENNVSENTVCSQVDCHVLKNVNVEFQDTVNQIAAISLPTEMEENVTEEVQDGKTCVGVNYSAEKHICSEDMGPTAERNSLGTLKIPINLTSSTTLNEKTVQETGSLVTGINKTKQNVNDTVMSQYVTSTLQISSTDNQGQSENELSNLSQLVPEKSCEIKLELVDDKVHPETTKSSKETEHFQEMKSIAGRKDSGILEVKNQLRPIIMLEVKDNGGISKSQLESKISLDETRSDFMDNVISDVSSDTEGLYQESQKIGDDISINSVATEQTSTEIIAMMLDTTMSSEDPDISKKTEDDTNSGSKESSLIHAAENDDKVNITVKSNQITASVSDTESGIQCSQEISRVEVSSPECQNISDAVTPVVVHTEQKGAQHAFEDMPSSVTLPGIMNSDKEETLVKSSEVPVNTDSSTACSQINTAVLSGLKSERSSNRLLSASLPDGEIIKIGTQNIQIQDDTNNELSKKITSSLDVKQPVKGDSEILEAHGKQLTHSEVHDTHIVNEVEESFLESERKPPNIQSEVEDTVCSSELTPFAQDTDQVSSLDSCLEQKLAKISSSQSNEMRLPITNVSETMKSSENLDIVIKKTEFKDMDIPENHSSAINDQKDVSLLDSNKLVIKESKPLEVSERTEKILHVKEVSDSNYPVSGSIAIFATAQKNVEMISSQQKQDEEKETLHGMAVDQASEYSSHATENIMREALCVNAMDSVIECSSRAMKDEKKKSLLVEDVNPVADSLPCSTKDKKNMHFVNVVPDPEHCATKGEEKESLLVEAAYTPVEHSLCATEDEGKETRCVKAADSLVKYSSSLSKDKEESSLSVEYIGPDSEHSPHAAKDEAKESSCVKAVDTVVEHLSCLTKDKEKESLLVEDVYSAASHLHCATKDKQTLCVTDVDPVTEHSQCTIEDKENKYLLVKIVDPVAEHIPCATEDEGQESVCVSVMDSDSELSSCAIEDNEKKSVLVEDLDPAAKHSLCATKSKKTLCFTDVDSGPEHSLCPKGGEEKNSVLIEEMDAPVEHSACATEDERKVVSCVKAVDPIAEHSSLIAEDERKDSLCVRNVDSVAQHSLLATKNEEKQSLLVERMDAPAEHSPCAMEDEEKEYVLVKIADPATEHSLCAIKDEMKISLLVENVDTGAGHSPCATTDKETLHVMGVDSVAEFSICATEDEGTEEAVCGKAVDSVAERLPFVTTNEEKKSLLIEEVGTPAELSPCATGGEGIRALHINGVDSVVEHASCATKGEVKMSLLVEVVDPTPEHSPHTTKEKESSYATNVDPGTEHSLCTAEDEEKEYLLAKIIDTDAEHSPCTTKDKDISYVREVNSGTEHSFCATEDEKKESLFVEDVDTPAQYSACATGDEGKVALCVKTFDSVAEHSPFAAKEREKKSLLVKYVDESAEHLPCAVEDKGAATLCIEDVNSVVEHSSCATKYEGKESLCIETIDSVSDHSPCVSKKVKQKSLLVEDMDSATSNLGSQEISDDICVPKKINDQKYSQEAGISEIVCPTLAFMRTVSVKSTDTTESNLKSDNSKVSKCVPNTITQFSTTDTSLSLGGKVSVAGDAATENILSQNSTTLVKDLGLDNDKISIDDLKFSVKEDKHNMTSEILGNWTSIDVCEVSEPLHPPFTGPETKRSNSSNTDSEVQVNTADSVCTAEREREYFKDPEHFVRDLGLENSGKKISDSACNTEKQSGVQVTRTMLKVEDDSVSQIDIDNTESENLKTCCATADSSKDLGFVSKSCLSNKEISANDPEKDNVSREEIKIDRDNVFKDQSGSKDRHNNVTLHNEKDDSEAISSQLLSSNLQRNDDHLINGGIETTSKNSQLSDTEDFGHASKYVSNEIDSESNAVVSPLVTANKPVSSCEEVLESGDVDGPSILLCNVSIVADTRKVIEVDLGIKSFTSENVASPNDMGSNETKESGSSIIENTYHIKEKFAKSNKQVTKTVLDGKVIGDICPETDISAISRETNDMHVKSTDLLRDDQQTCITDIISNATIERKPLSLENLSIALAGEMEDSAGHLTSHEINFKINSFNIETSNDGDKVLTPQDALTKTFENSDFQVDSSRTSYRNDKKIYSTLDLQQILEGSDDSKHKLEDGDDGDGNDGDDGKTVAVPGDAENNFNQSKDIAEDFEKIDDVKSQLTSRENENTMLQSNSDNLKETQKGGEIIISPHFVKVTELSSEDVIKNKKSHSKDAKKRCSFDTEVIAKHPLNVNIGMDLPLCKTEFLLKTSDHFEKLEKSEEAYKGVVSSTDEHSIEILSENNAQKVESSISKEDSFQPVKEKLKAELKNVAGSCVRTLSAKKRRHTIDGSPEESKNNDKSQNTGPPRKRKRRSSLCSKLISDCQNDVPQLQSVKDSKQKRVLKYTGKLETPKSDTSSNVFLPASSADDVAEKEIETSKQPTTSETNNSDFCTKIEERSLDQIHNTMESVNIKCPQEADESPIPSSNMARQRKRKLEDTDQLSGESDNSKIDGDVPAIVDQSDLKTDSEDRLTDHKPKRRRKSVENTSSDPGVQISHRQSRRRCRTNLLKEDGSSNSSVGSGFDTVEGRRPRRSGRKNKNVNNVTLDENSTSNEASEDNTASSSAVDARKKDETEPLQKVLPFDSELSVMSEDSVFSQSDSLADVDTKSNYSLELLDDSASSTVGSLASEDSKDWQEDSQVENDDEKEVEPPMKRSRGRGRSKGRGRRGQGRGRRGRGGRGRGASRSSNSLTREASEPADAKQLGEENEKEVIQVDLEEEVQCGKCAEKMRRKTYDRHNISVHNGLGWLEGEPPFDMCNEKNALSILWKVIKNHKKYLSCEKCGVVKKSAVGFLSHVEFCQRTAEEREALKVKCEICGRYMIRASLKVHQQVHKNEKKPEFVDGMRTKRAAAEKATSLMQEVIKEESEVDDKKQFGTTEENTGLYRRIGPVKPSNPVISKWKRLIAAENTASCIFPGCSFASSEVPQLVQHFGNCEKSPKRAYRCDVCNFQTKSEKEMKNHLENEHIDVPDVDSDPEEQDVMKKCQSKGYGWKVCNKLLFLAREMHGSVHGDKPYIPAVKWTLKFWRENYTTEDLFPQYHTNKTDWLPILESDYEEYLPQTKESISFATVAMRGEVVNTDAIEFQWKKMKMFESEIIDGVPTLFTGGPIWALAWCTVPLSEIQSEATEQFLALSCHQQMSDTYKSNERYECKGLIQLWNFGPLDNLQRPTNNPKFALGIAHDYGVVWDMEWCPSGCYETTLADKHNQRLGLLAVACSDGCVHIFSVCFPSSLESSERYPIYKCKPVMSLMVNEDPMHRFGSLPWSCLRLSWYKGKGHSIIAGGFNNGIVALWNIKTESTVLKKEYENTLTLLPYQTYQAHLSCITALSLAPQDEGRYLMTGSIDTTVKIWDLEDTSGPIPPVMRKGMVTDGVWLTHWLSSVTSYDDVYSMGHCNTTLNPPRGYGFKIFPLLPQNSVTWSVSTTDWVNGIAHSTHAGELTAIFPHQLMLNVDTEKGMKDKRLILSYVELKDIVKKNNEHSCNPSCSVPCQKKQLINIKNVVQSRQHSKESNKEEIVFQLEEAGESETGLSFIIERNPRKGKKCVIKPLLESSSNPKSTSQSPSRKENKDEQSVIEDVESISVLSQHERKLLLNFKKDLERLNVTSKLKVTFPYHNSERKKSNSNDTVKEYLMVVGSVKEDDSIEENSMDESAAVLPKVPDGSQFVGASDDYTAVESKFGLVFCDFPADDMASIPATSRLWMRRSESMRTAAVEMYPITSLNKVKWNPNCHSFLWLAAGYQCGLLRVPCISGMHNREVENILRNSSV